MISLIATNTMAKYGKEIDNELVSDPPGNTRLEEESTRLGHELQEETSSVLKANIPDCHCWDELRGKRLARKSHPSLGYLWSTW